MATSETNALKITNIPVFIWRLGVMILMGANPLLGPLEGDFQGPHLALLMDLPASKS
jgi:hypothetical protein